MSLTIRPSVREYSADELAAARRAKVTDPALGRGVIFFASGPYWPTELERRAKAHRKLADAEELIAAAMRREQAKDGTA